MMILFTAALFLSPSGIRVGMEMISAPSEQVLMECLDLLEPDDLYESRAIYTDLMAGYGYLLNSSEGVGTAAETAFRIGLISRADSLLHLLADSFPQSNAFFSCSGLFFRRIIYSRSAMEDSTLTAKYAGQLLSEYPYMHPYWIDMAFLELSGDSLHRDSILSAWTDTRPDSPMAWLKRAENSAEDSLWADELELSERGREVFPQWSIPGMPEARSRLIIPSLGNHLTMRRAEALFMLGDSAVAFETIEPLLRTDLYPVTDYHSPAPFFLLAGRITGNRDYLFRAAEAGDLENRYAGEAESLLRMELGHVYMDSARAGYTGPVFAERTREYLGDEPVPGVRHCWFFLNDDSLPDLITGDRLYLNDGDSLEYLGSLGHPVNGAAAADLDQDGSTDLVTGGHIPAIWLQTDTTGVFEHYPLTIRGGPIEGITFTDWNNDSLPDIVLAVYETPGREGQGNSDVLILNEGGGRFSETDLLNPWPEEPGCGRDADPADVNGDGLTDLVISNYRHQPDHLWINRGEERPVLKHLTDQTGFTVGTAFGDYDSDGDLDIFLSRLTHPRDLPELNRSSLLRNDNGAYTDVTDDAGIRYEETQAYPVRADFNMDGYPDLYITSIYENRRSFLYLNNGDGTFTDVTWLSGTRVFDGWWVSTPDINHDGLPDLSVNAEGRLRIFINQGR